MMYWTWDSSLEVGIEVIDSQHRRIIDFINELHAAKKDNDPQKVSEVLTGLKEYTISHFSFEEELMAKAGYPLTDAHIRVHRRFSENIDTAIKQHNLGTDVTSKLLSMLQVWLTNHIKNDDADYAELVKKQLHIDESWIKRAIFKFFS